MKQDVVVLAAGKGSRMKSNKSKVLHEIAGEPMIRRVLNTATTLSDVNLHLIVGHQGESVANVCQDFNANLIWQNNPKGTGDAVKRAADSLDPNGLTLTLYGDVPLIRSETLEKMASLAGENTLVLLTVILDDANGYGRIVRDDTNKVIAIVEQKDADEEEKRIKEANTGILLAPNRHLLPWLSQLNCNNAQEEYYLTDVIAMAARDGVNIVTVHPTSEAEVSGVNDKIQLAQLERECQESQAITLMAEGLTLADPKRFDLRGTLKIGMDCKVDINCIFEGEVTLGDNVTIGANCHLKDCVLGDNCVVSSNTLIDDSIVSNNCNLGPFARLRPGTQLAESAKIGNFVETKKAIIGKGSKVNHLSYIGDTLMGEGVNVGAGTITCNYDGVNKSQTQIGDGVFVGSNSSLVAPVEIGENATIAAGSTITKSVTSDQLAFARARQANKDNWPRPIKKK
ncbi:UDP-N-acetylglucosamine diphosphorylase/glucosamine-1-phosphate N-acetyltransferase [Marinomonas sp. 42_23_T18]|nr:UDP-N-acetylglucosamine diphosphorylase/glucosamine-1-phosphate N-acetyltransferase [Marinomonas sp. 42_23_T18]